MKERLKYHFQPQKGWINDPNGPIYFKNQYHMFYQFNPLYPDYKGMCWGHAVSDDLIKWAELPVAIKPEYDYEREYGCWSGSSVIKDGRLYLIYTGTSYGNPYPEFRQKQCVAYSDDGINFIKHPGNPVIENVPEDGQITDFRDPKVFKFGDKYNMLLASGKDGTARILRYTSYDLFDWEYKGVFYENNEYTKVFECPDFYEFEGKYMLVCSMTNVPTMSTLFVYGDFDGEKFVPISIHRPEIGPDIYAPQTFTNVPDGRIIMIGWMHHCFKVETKGLGYAGAMCIPREISFKNGKLHTYPVKEAQHLLEYSGDLAILRDTRTIEIFINGGEKSITSWLDE